MNLILLKSGEIESNNSATLGPSDARTKHILRHLRKQSGDEVAVGVIGGNKGRATVRSQPVGGNGSLKLELKFDARCAICTSDSSAEPFITLVLAVPFPKRLKALWPVVASMGVSRVVLIRAQLSDAEHCKSSSLREGVFRPLIEEGMAQGGHTRTVEVDVSVDEVVSSDVLKNLGIGPTQSEESERTHVAKVFLDCGDESGAVHSSVRDVIINSWCGNTSRHPKGSVKLAPKFNGIPSAIVAVGPERGWTDGEAKLFKQTGFDAATLGRSILRVDTAVISGLALASASLDECSRSPSHKRKRETTT